MTQNYKRFKSIIRAAGLLTSTVRLGLRNSFGIDFDPLTGKLSDTENGAGSKR